jgi:hypothetical protein
MVVNEHQFLSVLGVHLLMLACVSGSQEAGQALCTFVGGSVFIHAFGHKAVIPELCGVHK